jgi:hypothetical protein
MVKPKSILTDTSIDLLAEIIRQSGNHHAPQIVEAALREYLRHLKQQAEYTCPHPSEFKNKENE